MQVFSREVDTDDKDLFEYTVLVTEMGTFDDHPLSTELGKDIKAVKVDGAHACSVNFLQDICHVAETRL